MQRLHLTHFKRLRLVTSVHALRLSDRFAARIYMHGTQVRPSTQCPQPTKLPELQLLKRHRTFQHAHSLPLSARQRLRTEVGADTPVETSATDAAVIAARRPAWPACRPAGRTRDRCESPRRTCRTVQPTR
mmetsp:Transcript_18641/g.42888  ORF Transcript_18641/g.42888 Transcript_18641/m.42888 type:complete len:131 (-) Transcript_18641:277-669(-)